MTNEIYFRVSSSLEKLSSWRYFDSIPVKNEQNSWAIPRYRAILRLLNEFNFRNWAMLFRRSRYSSWRRRMHWLNRERRSEHPLVGRFLIAESPVHSLQTGLRWSERHFNIWKSFWGMNCKSSGAIVLRYVRNLDVQWNEWKCIWFPP